MVRKRHTAEAIVAKLRQVEVLTAQGRSVAEAIRSIGVTEVSSGTSCSTERSSPRSRRPGSSSRAGAGTTTRSGRTRRWATSRPPQRSCCGRLRFPGQLRRPPRPWRSDPSSTNSQPGPPNGGQPTWSQRNGGCFRGSARTGRQAGAGLSRSGRGSVSELPPPEPRRAHGGVDLPRRERADARLRRSLRHS